jgi:hypothetical protein
VAPTKVGTTYSLLLERKTNESRKWFWSPSQRPFSTNACDLLTKEATYWAQTQEADCGSLVFDPSLGEVVGMHVGTKGDDAGGLFVYFGVHTLAALIKDQAI